MLTKRSEDNGDEFAAITINRKTLQVDVYTFDMQTGEAFRMGVGLVAQRIEPLLAAWSRADGA